MAEALDSAYMWGINPLNAGKLNSRQLEGLASLAPQTGLGLQTAPRPTALDPYSNMPTPGFAPNAADYFGFTPQTVLSDLQGQSLAHEGQNYAGPTPPGDIAPGTDKPYFDPNYPFESMVALRKWLAPKVEAGAAGAMHSRGLDYSGVGSYAAKDAGDYLSQIAPNVSDKQALAMDINRLYGPDIANSLMSGSHHDAGGLAYSVPRSLQPGATPFAGGGHVSQAALVSNPDYAALPSGPPADSYPGLNVPTPGTIGLLGLGGAGAPAPAAAGGEPPLWQQPYKPQFGLFDFASDQAYATPGYWYDPSHQPDRSRMPWLANATSPTSGTSGQAP